jgi:predicted MFS family arabinose efflux permease
MDQKKQNYIVIFSLWLLVFAASSQIMIIAPILPRIGEQLMINEQLLGTLITAYALMTGFLAIFTGPISDKVGRRRILLYGTAGMAVALALHGLAESYITLLLARAAAGGAGGILSGSAVSYVGDYFPYERRGWANGWIMSGIAMGQIVGIPLGILLAEHFGFQAPFLSFSLLMGGAFFLIFFFVPQPNVERDTAKITIFNLFDKYKVMLKRSTIRAAALSYFLMFLSVSVYITFLPTWLEQHFGVTGNAISGLFLVGGIANVITGPNIGKLSDRIGRKQIILISCYGFAALMLATTYVLVDFWLAYPLFFILMMLVAMRISPFQALLTELVTGRNRGALMSLLVAIGQVGFGIGGAIAGPAFTKGGFVVNTVIGAVMIIAMALLVWKYIPEPKMKSAVIK